MAGNPLAQLMFPLLMLGVIYFMLIRPHSKQQKEMVQMQTNLKKHDEVVTAGGLHGTVVDLKDQTVTLRIDDSVRIKVDRTSITRLVKEG